MRKLSPPFAPSTKKFGAVEPCFRAADAGSATRRASVIPVSSLRIDLVLLKKWIEDRACGPRRNLWVMRGVQPSVKTIRTFSMVAALAVAGCGDEPAPREPSPVNGVANQPASEPLAESAGQEEPSPAQATLPPAPVVQ